MRARTLRAFAALLAALPLLAASADETSVRPGANARFLAPDLDVAHWVETFEGESREIARSLPAILEALALEPGMRVGDIGAGTGLFLAPLTDEVGSGGRVYAVEISPGFVAHLRRRVAEEELGQVEVIRNGEHSADLPEASIDLALLCDVYHHFEYPQAMLASLRRALRPGGRLVVIDFERIPGKSREWILDHVRAGKQETRNEIVAAGFTFEGEIEVEGLDENYLLEFRSPQST